VTATRALDALVALAGLLTLGALLGDWWRPEEAFLLLVAMAALRWAVAPPAWPAPRPGRLVAGAVVAYTLLFSFVTVTRHLALRTHALDLGYYVQLTWNLARGAGPRVSLPEMHAWGDHLSPIMYAFVPALWLLPGAGVLLVAQSAILALGAPAVFLLARRWLGSEPEAAVLAVLYLLNPTLHGINLRDFHAAALAIPLLLWGAVAADGGRWPLLAGAVSLALATREDAALAVLGLGGWAALVRRRWWSGAALATAALGVLYLAVNHVIPAFRGEPYTHLWRYEHLGRSVGEIAGSVLLSPARTAADLLTLERGRYLVALLVPLGFLPLAAPAQALGALPALAQNLLSRDPILFHHRTQYQAFVLPFLLLGAVGGYARLRGRGRTRAARLLLGLALVGSLAMGARTVNDLAPSRWWPTPALRQAHAALGRVPAGAAVSAQDPYVPHLALRERVHVFPAGLDRSDYVLLDTRSYPWRNEPSLRLEREADQVVISDTRDGRSFRYAVAFEAGPHLVLRRR
jgi:uncharacterized membrane protein